MMSCLDLLSNRAYTNKQGRYSNDINLLVEGDLVVSVHPTAHLRFLVT